MEIKLHLDEQSFSDTPTKTQLSNLLGDLISFQTKTAGAILAKEEYSITDEPMGLWLNALVALRRAKDAFDGVSTAGMAVANPQGMAQVPRRG